MIRREFCKTLTLASSVLESRLPIAKRSVYVTNSNFPKAPGLTKYVAEFIVNTKYDDIPEEVIELGKKTMLDAFGLALAGSASMPGANIRKYIERLGCSNGKASIIGTGLKTTHRFAALANGISIHADDYDDTGSGMHVAATAEALSAGPQSSTLPTRHRLNREREGPMASSRFPFGRAWFARIRAA